MPWGNKYHMGYFWKQFIGRQKSSFVKSWDPLHIIFRVAREIIFKRGSRIYCFQ